MPKLTLLRARSRPPMPAAPPGPHAMCVWRSARRPYTCAYDPEAVCGASVLWANDEYTVYESYRYSVAAGTNFESGSSLGTHVSTRADLWVYYEALLPLLSFVPLGATLVLVKNASIVGAGAPIDLSHDLDRVKSAIDLDMAKMRYRALHNEAVRLGVHSGSVCNRNVRSPGSPGGVFVLDLEVPDDYDVHSLVTTTSGDASPDRATDFTEVPLRDGGAFQ